MSKSLVSRLSSPQEFVDRCPARLSFDPFADEDPDNYPECRHRPAVEQVDYILAQDKGKAPATRIRSTEEKEAEHRERMEFIAAALKQFDEKKSEEPAVETARIEEVIDEKDFLQGL